MKEATEPSRITRVSFLLVLGKNGQCTYTKKGGTLNEETNGSTRKQHLEGVSGRTFVTTKEMKLYFMTSKDDKDSFLSSFSAE